MRFEAFAPFDTPTPYGRGYSGCELRKSYYYDSQNCAFMGRISVDWLLQAIAIFGMFVLRLGVPLAITLAVGYWLRRLDAKWQAEAQARWKANQAQREAKIEPQTELVKVIQGPCWVLKGCPETVYPQCPAYHHSDIPCWLAWFQAERAIPARCYRCTLFSPRQAEKYQLN
jgi:hypothetical protein